MTKSVAKPAVAAAKELLTQDPDGLRKIVRDVRQAMLEAEMDEAIGAARGQRTSARLGYVWIPRRDLLKATHIS